jgi:hypothetical protein
MRSGPWVLSSRRCSRACLDVTSDRGHTLTFLLCGAAVAFSAIPYALLTDDVESASRPDAGSTAVVDPETRSIVPPDCWPVRD